MALAHLFSPPAPPEILLPAQNHFGPGRSTVSPVSGPVTHTLPCRLRLIGQAAPFLGAFPDARPAPWALCDPLPSCPVWAFRTAVNSDRQRQSGRQWGGSPAGLRTGGDCPSRAGSLPFLIGPQGQSQSWRQPTSNTSQVKGRARSEACSLSRSFNNGFGFFSSVCSFIFFVGT